MSFQWSTKHARWDVAASSDRGRVRPINEDSYRIELNHSLFVLSDGMGGAAKGEIASAIAVESVIDSLRNNDLADSPQNRASPPKFSQETNSLLRAIDLANRNVHEHALRDPACRGMGATIVAARICGSRLSLVHVGDSRAYLFRSHRLEQLTADHSLVAEQVRKGLMTREEAALSDLQSVLTRALGAEESVDVDADEIELFPGDSLLLCSDGLTRMVPEDEIAEIMAQDLAAQMAAETLVNRANECGGLDNVTVVVIRVNKSKNWLAKFVPWWSANLV